MFALCGLASVVGVAADEPALSSTSSHSGRETDLRVLLNEVGPKMHKHFVADPRVTNWIDIGDLNHKEITYDQLLLILEINGYVVEEDQGLAMVIPNIDMRQFPSTLVNPDSIKVPDGEVVTCLVQLKNLSGAQLVPMLRPLIPSYGHLAPFAERNVLLLVDRAGNVKRLVEIIRKLDAIAKPAEALQQPTSK
jgi:general secretion pathway protein D